jgi:hypothetical protein
VYPLDGAARAYGDTVVKVFASEPAVGVDAATFTLSDATGARIPARVDQIGSAAWGLFPDAITLTPGGTYTARVARGVCDVAGRCTRQDRSWRFTVARDGETGAGDTSLPAAFGR